MGKLYSDFYMKLTAFSIKYVATIDQTSQDEGISAFDG